MKKEPEAPAILETYETEIEFDCPVRGRVKQKVKVKRYAPVETPTVIEEPPPSKSLTQKLDEQFSGIIITDSSLEDEQQKDELVDGED